MTADIKFWSIFIPFSERTHEVERLSFGPSGEGSGSGSEFVIEILARGINNHSRKRGTERVLEGWDSNKNLPCSISDLQDLKLLFSQKPVTEVIAFHDILFTGLLTSLDRLRQIQHKTYLST